MFDANISFVEKRGRDFIKHSVYYSYQAWDESDDIRQIEHGYVIRTKTKHGTRERSASPSCSTSVQQEQSENSDSPSMVLF